MNRSTTLTFTSVLLLSIACGGGAVDPTLPVLANRAEDPEATLIWLGRGEVYRFEEGEWMRRPSQDYEFSVVQRRYGDHWSSIKEMHRRHPDYDGIAGPRDQAIHFAISYSPATSSRVPFQVTSTLGDGAGQTDPEFRAARLELAVRDVGPFSPFNTIRLDQRYLYEEGRLEETVRLTQVEDDGSEDPYVRVEEVASLFAPRRFVAPPTVASR